MAVTAGNGGFLPWQQGLATRFGRFQFVAARELGVDCDSIRFDLPIIEHRP
ncbi:MAG: hypothetical protein P8R42_11770 [Candidatus Binatia bacterium]|nr:hypothetical protein [Candidatus Binatia bacterium]